MVFVQPYETPLYLQTSTNLFPKNIPVEASLIVSIIQDSMKHIEKSRTFYIKIFS